MVKGGPFYFYLSLTAINTDPLADFRVWTFMAQPKMNSEQRNKTLGYKSVWSAHYSAAWLKALRGYL